MTVTTKYGRANLSGGRYDLPRYTISMEESVAHHLAERPEIVFSVERRFAVPISSKKGVYEP